MPKKLTEEQMHRIWIEMVNYYTSDLTTEDWKKYKENVFSICNDIDSTKDQPAEAEELCAELNR